MIKLFYLFCLFALPYFGLSQGLPEAMKLPDYVLPTPEVSSLLKADNLSVSNSTGSPNINIPIGELSVNGIKVPINLAYNSTGIKVDEYASMVGMGWNCSYGGVVSRTVYGKPDEHRDGSSYPTNLSNPNFSSQDAALLNFLKNHPDAESDIFSFSFLNYSGKFILDSNFNVIPLSNYNLKITTINDWFQNGFLIVTPDGAIFRFDEIETSQSRNPMGTYCPKSYDSEDNITSWYLTKITSPNKRSYINFTYLTQSILFEQSISQYISEVIDAENHPYPAGSCPSGPAQPLGSETFYTCVTRQTVSSKFISTIITSANDTATFSYSGSEREDLEDGKRLSGVKITNRNGKIVKQATFYASYSSGFGNSSHTNANKRMYLDSLSFDDVINSANSLWYKFDYLDRSNVSARLSFLQDIYGYSNGKYANPSMIPKLPSTDMNYLVFDSGRQSTTVEFGDRSVDTVYAMKGLLNKITYPTGGYDSILYSPNKYYNGSSNVLAGGSSVTSIHSYSFGLKVLEKSYSYLDTTGNSSTFIVNTLSRCSDRTTIGTDGYSCYGCEPPSGCFPSPVTEGPTYTIAHVSSNLSNPIASLGQHAYHRTVTERIVDSINNGYTRHFYSFFAGGNILPYDLLGNNIPEAPLQIMDNFEWGEHQTEIFRYDTSTSIYKIQKRINNYLFLHNTATYHNYVIKKNFMPLYTNTPPAYYEFHPFDVTKYAINKYVIYIDSTKEVTYDNNNDSFIVKTTTQYANTLHSYPTKHIIYTPDGDSLETRKVYPLDGSASVLTYRNIVAPTLEEKKYRNGVLLSTITNTYNDWFNDSTVVAVQQNEYKELTNSMPVYINFYNYDTLGNVLDLAKDSGSHMTYVWGYSKQFPIVKAINAQDDEIFYTSFEETDGTADSLAKTGGYSHSGSYTVSFTLPNAKSYILTYWKWDGSEWDYYETAYTGSTTITATLSKIDEVRVFPIDAQLLTFTYEPMIGITSQCDIRNQVIYYEYDQLNRLLAIRDENRKILKLFEYKYQQ